MYISLPAVQNGVSIPLANPIDNQKGQLQIALCDILYHPLWTNIGEAHGNDTFLVGKAEKTHQRIPAGYYSVCMLNKEIFEPLKASLTLNTATGYLKLIPGINQVKPLRGLAETLGLTPETGQGNKLPSLAPHKEFSVHLNELNTSGNIPPTVLRMVPVKKEKFNSGRTESFAQLQYKPLRAGPITELTISVLDSSGYIINIGYLSLTLHIAHMHNGGCIRPWTIQTMHDDWTC